MTWLLSPMSLPSSRTPAGNRSYFEPRSRGRVASAGFPTNFGAQPLLDVRFSLSLLKSFQIKTVGRQLGDFLELDRLSRKPVFTSLRVSNIRTLLNHLDASRCANRHQLSP